jgi:hypothetical protein
MADKKHLQKIAQILLVLSGLLISSSTVSNNFLQEATPTFALEMDTSNIDSVNNISKNAALSENLPEDFKKIIKSQISKIFSDMLSKVDERYVNQELGLQIDFPNGWQGTLIKPANALILSPPEINVTSYMVNATENGLYSFINSIPLTGNITMQDILHTGLNAVMGEVFQSLENLTPTISVSAISKDSIKSFQNLSGIEPPTKSLASIWYDYTSEVTNKMLQNLIEGNNTIGRNEVRSINHSEINGIPTEISISKTNIPQLNEPFKSLGYLFLTKDNIVNVEYTGNTSNFNKYLPEFEKSIKSVKITSPIPINEENIKQFTK